MKYNHNTIVLRDSDDENTFAMLACEVESDQYLTDKELRDIVSEAVKAWREKTENGSEAWVSTCEDFNIADLNMYQDDHLREELRKRGVDKLTINVHSFESFRPTLWSFDDVLGK